MPRLHVALGLLVSGLGLGLFDVLRGVSRTHAPTSVADLLLAWLAAAAAVVTICAPLLWLRFEISAALSARARVGLGALDGAAFGVVALLFEQVVSVPFGRRVAYVAALAVGGAFATTVVSRVPKARTAICLLLGVILVAYAETLTHRGKMFLRLSLDVVAMGAFTTAIAALAGQAASRRLSLRLLVAALVLLPIAGHVVLARSMSVRAFVYDNAPHAHAFLAHVRLPTPSLPLGNRPCPPGAQRSVRAYKESRSTGSAAQADVLFLSFDAMRYDQADSIPQVWKEIGPHVLFTRAVVPAPRTINSLSAVLRGVPVRQVSFEGSWSGETVAQSATAPIAQILVANGYRAVHVPTHRSFGPSRRLNLGFELAYTEDFAVTETKSDGWYEIVRAREALAKALEIAKGTKEPLLLWVHLMEGHEPYRWDGGRGPASLAGQRRAFGGVDGLAAEFLRHFRAARGTRKAVVAIFGDHGEEFGEHGGSFHSTTLHAEQVRAALAFAAPAIDNAVIDAPVSHSALPATVLDLLGLPPAPTFSEATLLPCLDARAACPDLAVSQMAIFGHSIGYTFDRYRMIVDPDHSIERLYDNDTDPFEYRDIAEREPKLMQTLRARAQKFDQERCVP